MPTRALNAAVKILEASLKAAFFMGEGWPSGRLMRKNSDLRFRALSAG
jgi:hypothetical protein